MSDALILDGDGTGGNAGAAALLAPNARLEPIAHGGDLFQGPVWLGDALVFSDLEANTVLAWDADRGTRTWISYAAFQNGHALDPQGLLYAASHGERAIVRRELDGRWVIVADLLEDRRFNGPSDLAITADGAVWFTDPRDGLTHPIAASAARPRSMAPTSTAWRRVCDAAGCWVACSACLPTSPR